MELVTGRGSRGSRGCGVSRPAVSSSRSLLQLRAVAQGEAESIHLLLRHARRGSLHDAGERGRSYGTPPSLRQPDLVECGHPAPSRPLWIPLFLFFLFKL